MATILLKDKMGTKYIINALCGTLHNILEECVASGDTLDLADCKLGPDAAYYLNLYYDKVNFINSTDEYLNGVLENNISRTRDVVEEYEPVDMSNVKTINTFFDLVEAIPQGARIKPIISLSKVLDKANLTLLIMARPDIEFDIRHCASDIYDFVRDAWLSSPGHHDKYYECVAPDTVIREVTPDGYYGSRSYGYQKEVSFVRNRRVLPYDFGNKKILKLDGSPVEDEWRLVAEKCMDLYETSYVKKGPGKVLRNLLTFREE